jgi:hypothetical protein
MSIDQQSLAATKKCRYCCSDIPVTARICLQCKCYQSSIRNQLSLFAGFAGLIAILTYFTSSFEAIRKTLYWIDDLKLISADPNVGYVIQNSGDGTIFVDGIFYETNVGGRNSRTIRIYETVESGQIANHVPLKKGMLGAFAQIGGNTKIPDVESAMRLSLNSPDCVEEQLYSVNSLAYKTPLGYLGEKLLKILVTPKVVFYSRSSSPLEREFDGVIVFIENYQKKDCWK